MYAICSGLCVPIWPKNNLFERYSTYYLVIVCAVVLNNYVVYEVTHVAANIDTRKLI